MSDCDCQTGIDYRVGNTYDVRGTFTDENGNLFDPVNAYAFGVDPTGAVTSLGTVTRISKGIYSATWAPVLAGQWVIRFSDSSTPPVNANATKSVRINVKAMV